MKLKLIHEWLIFIGFGLLAVWLFDGEGAGINIIIFEIPLLIAFLHQNKGNKNIGSPLFLFISLVFLLSLFGVLHTNSVLSIVVHIASASLFAGFFATNRIQSVVNLAAAMGEKIAYLLDSNPDSEKVTRKNKRLFLIVPVVICILYMVIYMNAVPAFGEGIAELLSYFEEISINKFLWLIAGTMIAAVILKKVYSTSLVAKSEQSMTDFLRRKRGKYISRFLAPRLNYELRMAFILISSLCVMLVPVIATDIYSYWFGIENVNAAVLKSIVHEGCYLLIVSITFSIVITLYVFRKNINFHPASQKLKTVTLIWLAGNGVMVLSVLIKNLWYIHYYGLAYKRIGVLVFLVATIFGIITVIFKIRKFKTAFYLLRLNALCVVLLFGIISCFDWDYTIASYNMEYTRDKLHKNYLVTMNERTLRLLLTEKDLFDQPVEYGDNYEYFITRYVPSTVHGTYLEVIMSRLSEIETKEKDRTWKSGRFNLP